MAIKRREMREGVTIVLTGDGKGKSSSAFGMAFRAAAWGMRVCVVQFIKGKWKTGEQKAAARFDCIEWHVLGDGFTWDSENIEQDIQTTQDIWALCKEKLRSHQFDLLVWDEINCCTDFGWISGSEVASFIAEEKPAWMHLVLTGRNASLEVVAVADTVTQMSVVKHAFDQKGVKAQQGIEF